MNQSEDALLNAMYPDKEYSEAGQDEKSVAVIIEYNNEEPPRLYQDLKIWCNAAGDLWDPHKEKYIETPELPKDLLEAYEKLWEGTGDDYLVEYRGQYYYMLDHVYHEKSVFKDGEFVTQNSYELATNNAKTIANCEALKDTIILLSKGSCWIGPEHFVSVLISPYEAEGNLKKIKETLNRYMFQDSGKDMPQSLNSQIQSASLRNNDSAFFNKDTKESVR